jgi:ferritin-like metal-binding protein YciE
MNLGYRRSRPEHWAYVELLGHSQAAKLLEQTLAEEEATDKKLTALGEGGINEAAMAVGSETEQA